jgi:hypothetical protein
MSKMTPSQQAKAAGLKSLKQVTEITGVSGNTLDNWHKHKPELFKTVLAGCMAAESALSIAPLEFRFCVMSGLYKCFRDDVVYWIRPSVKARLWFIDRLNPECKESTDIGVFDSTNEAIKAATEHYNAAYQ